MKNIIRFGFFVVAFASIFSVSARATTFNFSYTFADGDVWSGSFSGTANGNLVTGGSNFALLHNGVSVGPTIYQGHDISGTYVSGGAVFSFDGTQNNFILFDTDYFGGNPYFHAEFQNLQIPSYIYGADFNATGHGSSSNIDVAINTSRWSLTQAGQSVPDTVGTFLLTSSALVGLVALRRNLARA